MCSYENRLRYKIGKYQDVNAKLRDFRSALLDKENPSNRSSKRKNILLIVKGETNYKRFKSVFSEYDIDYTIYPVSNYANAVLFLEGEPPFSHIPAPDIIIVDSSLGEDFYRILSFIKKQDYLNGLSVIVTSINDSNNNLSVDDKINCVFGSCTYKNLTTMLDDNHKFYKAIQRI